MYKHIIAQAGDVNWMAIFALLTFVCIFTVTIVALFFKKKSYIDKMSNLPLED